MRTKFKKTPINTPIYIGIDFSINSPGISISFDDTIITHVFNFEALFPLPKIERWDIVTDQLVKFLNAHSVLKDSIIFLEDYAMGGKGKTNDIAECCGLLKYKLYTSKHPVSNLKLVSITHLKQFVAGIGNAKKELMIKGVYKLWGYDTNDNNAADAYSIMKVCRAICLPGVDKISAEQKTIIAKIIKYNDPEKPKKKKKKKK